MYFLKVMYSQKKNKRPGKIQDYWQTESLIIAATQESDSFSN